MLGDEEDSAMLVALTVHLSGDEVVEAVDVSQVSGQNDSLPAATLRCVADTKQTVTVDRIHLEAQRRRRGRVGQDRSRTKKVRR